MKNLTILETANTLGVSESKLWQLIREGKAPQSFKIGRRRMFRSSDVDAFVDAAIVAAAS